MPPSRQTDSRPDSLFWVVVVFLAIVAFTGGSSRIDVPSLLLLWPVAIIACALALITLRRDHLRGRGWLFTGLAAMAALILLQLIPLPPAIWHMLPGRQEIQQSDALAGLAGHWRPFTLTPINALHSLVSLAVPFAVLALASQLNRADLFRLLPLVIAIGAASGLVGLLQAAGAHSRLLDPYGVGFDRGAGGLFANRNHAALMLAMLFPMLAAWVRTRSGNPARNKLRVWGALTMATILCPLILVTGSRSGLLLAGLGLISAAIIVGPSFASAIPRARRHTTLIAVGVVVGFLILGFATFYLDRAEAIIRLLDKSTIYDPRFDSWPVSQTLLMKYLPLGAGAGSFVEIYKIIEPHAQLHPQYWNHAHNDFLEIGVTFGLPGLALLMFAAVAFLRCGFPLWLGTKAKDRVTTIARMASVSIAMMALASVTDYPVRTPIMMSVFALCCLWLVEPGRSQRDAIAPDSPGGQA